MKNICEQFSRANSVPGLLWLGVRQIAAQIAQGKNKFLMDGDNLSDMSLVWQISTCLSPGISVQVYSELLKLNL